MISYPMQHIPTAAEFKARGLLGFQLDAESIHSFPFPTAAAHASSSRKAPNSDWIEGWADLEPTHDYPLIAERKYSGRVRIHFCPSGDAVSASYFRRQAQVKALDTVPYTLKGSGRITNSPPTTSQDLPGDEIPRRFRPPVRILAWWEDDLGLWFIKEGAPPKLTLFLTVWSDIVGPEWPQLQSPQNSSTPASVKWYDACDLLLQASVCLQALHDRHISLNWCHPDCFAVLNKAVVVNRLWDATALPGLSLANLLTPTLVSSTLFTRDPIHHNSSRLTDRYVFRHLRYLAPEAAISRRVSPSNDIYGWGVFAYELVTGTTIDGGPDWPDLTDIDLLADIHRHVTTEIISPNDYLVQIQDVSSHKLCMPPKQLSDIIMMALAKDPEDRYHCLDSLSYDLRKLSQICRVNGDLSKFSVGEVDRISRFNLPATVIEREQELKALDLAFSAVADGNASNRVVSVWGQSGNGKTRLVEEWAAKLEVTECGLKCLIGRGKQDEQAKQPLSSFIEVFQSLLDRVLTDPREDPKVWIEHVRTALGTQWSFFVSLLSTESRRLIGEDTNTLHPPAVKWGKFLAAFKNWSREFLQLFATPERPLVLIVDDTQWIPQNEKDLWREIIDGGTSISHTLIVSITRCDEDELPQTSLFSAGSMSIPINKLTEDGVVKYINTCLNGRVASSGQAIASFLYSETQGSPLFLRTLMTTLLKEQVVSFDYDALQWRFDLGTLQSHLSDANFDLYLESAMRRLPSDVQDVLKMLSYLPNGGFPIDYLAASLSKRMGEVENLLQLAVAFGVVSIRLGVVHFSHDRQRLAAQSLVSPASSSILHQQVFDFLNRPDMAHDYLFDSADQALLARAHGVEVAPKHVILTLLLDATQRAYDVANFAVARRCIEQAQTMVDEFGGISGWIDNHRALCFRFVRLSTEISGIFRQHKVAFQALQQIKPLCKSSTEKISIATLYIRQQIAANLYEEAMEYLEATLEEFGYNPTNPAALTLWQPASVEDVEALGDELKDTLDLEAVNQNHILITSLIGFAGPTIYITMPQKRNAIFLLGMSLVKRLGIVHDSTAYLIAVHSMLTHNATIQYALRQLALRVMALRPNHFLTNSALIAIGAQAHCFMPMQNVTEVMDLAFNSSMKMADYEVGAYVVALDVSARLLSKVPCAWDITARRSDIVKPYATSSHLMLLNIQHQYSEALARPNEGSPWEMDGVFFGPSDLDAISELRLHQALYNCFQLRLKLLYDAPHEEIAASMEQAIKCRDWCDGLSFGAETYWLLGVAAVRLQSHPELVENAREFLTKYAEFSPDMLARLEFLDVLQGIQDDALVALSKVDPVLDGFEDSGQFLLFALLNFYMADGLIKQTGSNRLAAGFLRSAFVGYQRSECAGLCDMVRARMSPDVPMPAVTPRSASDFLGHDPIHQTASVTSHQISELTTTSSGATSISRDRLTDPGTTGVAGMVDNLDTLTLMRSSLVLAQEKDSLVLMCTLLRILCQFGRCDYAAIGLNDEEDKSTFRLKAAGPFQRIVPYDLDLSDATAQTVCPASLLLHVARTGNPITKASKVSRLQNDAFFNGRKPRTILCLPIINQGHQAGVILLLSMTSPSSAVQTESAREVVSTLANFAYIIHLHQVFTSRLKTEVEQRTRELSNALQAKTQFLSQCSHELRSPLAAIMGLAAVLEASPGLSAVQHEHLQTIAASGQDLLALISNILDHSKLESDSVQLENIPFNIRDTIESALDIIAPVAQSKNVELTALSTIKSDPPGVIGDPFRIKQVLLNLLSNAVKFTPPGEVGKRTARVTVDLTWEELDGDRIKASLAVADTGVGIPESKLSKLFRSFSQVDESITRSYGGSGLGLVISRDLARLLDGDCTVESEFGKGSKFTFTFQAKRDPEWKPTVLRKFSEPQMCFILSPGDMAWGHVLEEDLKLFNCTPIWFTEPVERALYPSHPQGLGHYHYNFLLLDSSLMDQEILKRIRKMQPNAKFLYVARATEISREMERLHIPREDILARPLKFKSLCETIIPAPADTVKMRPTRSKRALNRNLAKEKPLTVLVVDDSPVNIAVCRRILELYGYNGVDSASDGIQATEMAEKRRYDLILMDLQMPNLDGFGALSRIQNSPLAGDPVCVSLSANVDKATQSRCIDAGFYACLHKPVEIPRLGEVLDEVWCMRNKDCRV